MSGPAAAWLPGGRLHLQHGPIDLVVEAFGPEEERTAGYAQAWAAFRPVLDDLVAVLPLLRTPVMRLMRGPPILRSAAEDAGWAIPTTIELEKDVVWGSTPPAGPRSRDAFPMGIACGSVAARMLQATAPHAPAFVTPMAAVAGAVADGILVSMVEGRRLERAYVNNGGDAALWLGPGSELTAAGGPDLGDRIRITANDPVRGIATSGWRGRSHSLGIADAVTVLARTAAEADAAATLIANAVNLPGHPAIRRRAARELAPDSDLGDLPVTVAVGPLTPEEATRALAAGRAQAERILRQGLIEGAALWLAGEVAAIGSTLPPVRAAATEI